MKLSTRCLIAGVATLAAGQAVLAATGQTPYLTINSPTDGATFQQTDMVGVQVSTNIADEVSNSDKGGASEDFLIGVHALGRVTLNLGNFAPSVLQQGIAFNASYLATGSYVLRLTTESLCSTTQIAASCHSNISTVDTKFTVEGVNGTSSMPLTTIEGVEMPSQSNATAAPQFFVGATDPVASSNASSYCDSHAQTLATIDSAQLTDAARSLAHLVSTPVWIDSFSQDGTTVQSGSCLVLKPDAGGNARVTRLSDQECASQQLPALCTPIKVKTQ